MDDRGLSAVLIWMVTALSVVSFVAGFTIQVDPFGYFGTNSVGYYFSSERQFKRNLVKTRSYNAIVLGDSRIAYTDTSAVKHPKYVFVNGGIGGSDLAEQVALLKSSQLERLELAILGLQYADLNGCADTELTSSFWDALRFSASWTQLLYAIEAVQARARGDSPSYRADGTRSATSKRFAEAMVDSKTNRYRQKVEEHRKAPGTRLQLHDRCRALLADAKRMADKHGFDLVVVFLPRNSDLFTVVDRNNIARRGQIYALVSELKGITPNVVDLTESRLGESSNFWSDDPIHFRPEIGAEIIETAIQQSINLHDE